jgi:hypothetical protein
LQISIQCPINWTRAENWWQLMKEDLDPECMCFSKRFAWHFEPLLRLHNRCLCKIQKHTDPLLCIISVMELMLVNQCAQPVCVVVILLPLLRYWRNQTFAVKCQCAIDSHLSRVF